MRKLYLNEAALSAKATTVIHDEQNQSCYLLVGKWGLRADVLSVYTIAGELEAEVKQESLGLLPKFRLVYHRQVVGRVSKTFGVIREVLFVRGLNWVIMGSLTSGRFRIYHGRDQVATIAVIDHSGGGTVELTVDQPDHEALIVCLAAILNRWARHQQKLPELLHNHAWVPHPAQSGSVAPTIDHQKDSD